MFKNKKLYIFITLFLSFFILCGAVVLSKEGFYPISNIYYTDVKVYINGTKIEGFSNDDKILIRMEDLKDYGFDVVWDGVNRTISAKAINRKEQDLSQAESVVYDPK